MKVEEGIEGIGKAIKAELAESFYGPGDLVELKMVVKEGGAVLSMGYIDLVMGYIGFRML